jgi:uncharacterized membrane protein YkoI
VRIRIATFSVGGVALALAMPGVAATRQGHEVSRLDDGMSLLPQATITEQQAIAAATSAASGALNEIDLEHAKGRLVFTVDVGVNDVKVDAASGEVVSVDRDD